VLHGDERSRVGRKRECICGRDQIDSHLDRAIFARDQQLVAVDVVHE
jgi:hypothetical protein